MCISVDALRHLSSYCDTSQLAGPTPALLGLSLQGGRDQAVTSISQYQQLGQIVYGINPRALETEGLLLGPDCTQLPFSLEQNPGGLKGKTLIAEMCALDRLLSLSEDL